MQIFYLHFDPKIAAQQACDKHIVNQCRETMQIIATVWSIHKPRMAKRLVLDDVQIQPWSNPKHPSVRWAAASRANYVWVLKYFMHILDEFNFRYCHDHKYTGFLPVLYKLGFPMEVKKWVPMSPEYQAIPEELKDCNPCIAYRIYYMRDKRHFAKWNKTRSAPEWWL